MSIEIRRRDKKFMNYGIMKLTKEDVRWLKRIFKEGERNGCLDFEEFYGYTMEKWHRHILNQMRTRYAPRVRELLPWILDNIDKKEEKGEELEIIVKADGFLKMMGPEFVNIGYLKVSYNVRSTLQREGLSLKVLSRKGEKFYRFYAIGDDEARRIEERIKKSNKRILCRAIARKVCDVKIKEGEEEEIVDSIFTDAEFVSKIVHCNFDIDKMNEKIRKEKEKILNQKIRYGFKMLLI